MSRPLIESEDVFTARDPVRYMYIQDMPIMQLLSRIS